MSLSSFISPKKCFRRLAFFGPLPGPRPRRRKTSTREGKRASDEPAYFALLSRCYCWFRGNWILNRWFFFRKWLSGYEISWEVNSLLNSFRQLRSASTFCVGGTLVDINAFHKCQLWLSRVGTRRYWVNHTLIPLIQLRRISQPACDQMSKRSSSYFFLLRLSPELARTFAK